MAVRSRVRYGAVFLLWLLAGVVVAMCATMQYATFGGNTTRLQGRSKLQKTATHGISLTMASDAWNPPPAGAQSDFGRGPLVGSSLVVGLVTGFIGVTQLPPLALVAFVPVILGLLGKYYSVAGNGLELRMPDMERKPALVGYLFVLAALGLVGSFTQNLIFAAGAAVVCGVGFAARFSKAGESDGSGQQWAVRKQNAVPSVDTSLYTQPSLNLPSMPSMPSMNSPSLQGPSMPSLNFPSMPSVVMPSMPSVSLPSLPSMDLPKTTMPWESAPQRNPFDAGQMFQASAKWVEAQQPSSWVPSSNSATADPKQAWKPQ